MVVSPVAQAATISIYDNADQVHFKTTTVDVTTTPPGTTVTTVTGPVLYFGTNAYTDSSPSGWNASSVTTTSTTSAGVTTTTTTTVSVPLNGVQTINGGAFVIPSSVNRDVQTSPGGMGVSVFSAYSSLAQATGRFDLYDKKVNETLNRYYNTTGYDAFGVYTDRSTTSPTVGYFIDATDYSGAGNLRWTGANVAVVLAGNNTYTGDTFLAGTAIIQSGIGQGTLFLTSTGAAVFNTAVATQTIGNAFAGSGTLTFQGDTRLTSTTQTTTLTYDSVNFTGAVRVESGINGLNKLVLGDGSTTGATANTGTLGTGAIDVGRLDGDLGGGTYALTDLPSSTSAQLTFQLGGTKTISNASINLHARTQLENIGGAAGDLTVSSAITSGATDTASIVNTSGKLTFTGGVALGSGSYTTITNDSTQAMTFSGAITTGGQIDIANNSTGDLNLNGNVSGMVFIDQNGASTTTLAGNNGFTGIVAVNNAAGTLKFTNSNALGAGTIRLAAGTLSVDDGLAATNTITLTNAVNVAGSSTLSTNDNLIFTGAFTSPAAGTVLTKSGTANLTLTGNNDTFSGTFTIASGRLQAGNGGTTGTFGTNAITLAGTTAAAAIVAVNRSDAAGVTVGNLISGTGSFEQNGTGLTILKGANTYTGTTSVNAGTLQVGGTATTSDTAGNLGTGAVSVASGATLSFRRSDAVTVANAISGSGTLSHLAGDLTFTGAVSGVAVTKSSGGSLDITNASTLGNITNTGVGNTNINASGAVGAISNAAGFTSITAASTGALTNSGGDLEVYAGTTGAVAATGGTVYVAGNIVGTVAASNAATVTLEDGTLDGTSAVTLAGTSSLTVIANTATAIGNAISGTGTLIKDGTTQLTLTGALAVGAVTVVDGTLSVANSTNATLANVSVAAPSSKLVLAGSGDFTLNEFSGVGTIEQNGVGVVTLTDTAADYTGTLVLTRGTVAFAAESALDDATVKFNGGTLRYTGAGALTTGARSWEAEGNTLSFVDSTAALAFNGAITQTGTGTASIRKIGGGNLDVSGLTVLGSVQFIINSFDLLGVDTSTGNLNDNLDVTNSSLTPATFTINQTVDGTASGIFSGNLALVKNGDAALTLSGANNTYTGGTTVNAGSLVAGNGSAFGTGAVVLNGGSINLNGNTVANAVVLSGGTIVGSGTLTGVVSGAGILTYAIPSGTFTLSGTNTYSGGTLLSAGTLIAGSDAAFGTGTVTVSGGSLSLNNRTLANNITLAGGVLLGTGTLNGVLTATDLTVAAGTLTLNHANLITGTTTLTGGGITLGSGQALGSSAVSLQGGTLTLGGVTVANQIVFGGATVSGSGTLTGALSGTSLVYAAPAGTLVLTGANTTTGATTITAGTLVLGNGGTTGGLGSGAVVNNGVLQVNRSNAYVLGNIISGTGAFIQSGSGVTTFTGANTYAGITTISGGTLALGTGGTLGSGAVVNNATLAITGTDAKTLANVISGTGVFVVSAGTTTLTGANTYSGGTTIASGASVTLSGAGALGTGAVANGGVLTLTGQTVANVISGAGSLVASTGGSTLTGANTYTGGTTVGAGATLTTRGTLAPSGALAVHGALVVDSTTAQTITGSVSGAGSVTQTGAGTLTLTNATSFSGAYVVDVGSALVLTPAAIFGNTVTGGGDLTLTGSTTLTRSALNNAQVTVASGTLDLGGDPRTAQLASFIILNGATLSGQGSTGAIMVNAGGAFRPGNSPGVVNVAGDFVSNGAVTMEIAGNGGAGAPTGHDQVNATGNVVLNGSLNIVYTGGFTPSATGVSNYTLFTGANITGTALATVTIPSSGLGILTNTGTALVYSNHPSFATVTGFDVPSGIAPFDAAVVAGGASVGTRAGAILNVYNTQGAAAASQALINASPLGLASMTTLAVDEARGTTELMRTRLDAQRRETHTKQDLTAYAAITGATADAETGEVINGGANFDRKYTGGKVGLEKAGRGGIALGGNIGYDRGQADLLAGGGKVTQDHLSASGYISHRFDATTFMYVGAFGGLSKYDTERNTVSGKAKGDTQGWDLGVSLLFGKDIALDKEFVVTPYAGLTYMRATFDSYKEAGGAMAMEVADTTHESLRSKIGTDLDWKLPTGGVKARLGLGLVWEHELLDEQLDINASFVGGSSTFRTTAGTMAKDILGFGPHAEVEFGDGFSARLAYQYQYGFGDETGQRIDLTVTKRF